MSINNKNIQVSLNQLMLDPNNYRLDDGSEPKNYTSQEIIDAQDDIEQSLFKENIVDLEKSILKNGFLEVDKVVVRQLNDLNTESKTYLVIEGNRRVSAFKSLIRENYNKDTKSFNEDFPDNLIDKYRNINVVLIEGTEEEISDYSQRLMGIRHIVGAKKWGGYQSAKLIDDMMSSSHYSDYNEVADFLGIKHKEVQLRHEAYLALKQMREDLSYSHLSSTKLYTLFHEIVSSNKFFKEEWLEWNVTSKKFDNLNNLHRLYDAITTNKEIKNPSQLRSFVKFMSYPEVRLQVEHPDPILIGDVNFDFDEKKRIEKINGFISFLAQFHKKQNSEDEENALNELNASLSALLSKEGDK
ncbi:ParB N-terminal domain-containing protein [Vibrio splendidus]